VDVTQLRSLLEKLSNEIGVTGRERAVRRLVRDEITPLVDRVEVDALGNLVAFKAGDGPEPRPRIMLAAHMDEVGFMVTKIEKTGTLRFHKMGGVEANVWAGKRVLVGDERVPGVISAPVPHLQTPEQYRKPIDADSLFIDIGATNDKEALGKIKAGDYGTFATRFTVLSEDPAWPTVRGKAFDDRAGCTALIALLAERFPVDLVAVFTTQEEMGLRGARVAGYRVEPNMALALEGTIADDAPRLPDEDETPVTRLGRGPAVTIMDRSVVVHPGVLRLLREAARAENIAIQYKTPGMGGTDAGAIHTARSGVPAGVVAAPCRYIHSPAAILNLDDLAGMVRLVGSALRRFDMSYLDRRG
jgi:tetrahedral aminopeptidase